LKTTINRDWTNIEAQTDEWMNTRIKESVYRQRNERIDQERQIA